MAPDPNPLNGTITDAVGTVVGALAQFATITATLIAFPFDALALSLSWIPEVSEALGGSHQ